MWQTMVSVKTYTGAGNWKTTQSSSISVKTINFTLWFLHYYYSYRDFHVQLLRETEYYLLEEEVYELLRYSLFQWTHQ